MSEHSNELQNILDSINNIIQENDFIEQVRYGPSIDDVLNSNSDILAAKEEIKQNFILLLFTLPGEDHQEINKGIGIQRFLFDLQTPTINADINGIIRQQVSTYIPQIVVNNVSFENYEDSNGLKVSVNYSIPALDEEDAIDVEI